MIMRDCRGAIIATSPLPSDDQAAVESSLCIYIRCVPLSRTSARAVVRIESEFCARRVFFNASSSHRDGLPDPPVR